MTCTVEANPWAGQRTCPVCRSDRWALPVDYGSPTWRCVSCHVLFCGIDHKHHDRDGEAIGADLCWSLVRKQVRRQGAMEPQSES